MGDLNSRRQETGFLIGQWLIEIVPVGITLPPNWRQTF